VTRGAVLTLAIGLAAGAALTGCSADSSASTGGTPLLKVSGAFMPQPVGDLAAAFLIVTNQGGAADKLTSVTSALSDNISIHKTENQRMQEVKSFSIPAGGKLDLERGGSHIMFMNVKQPLKQGQKVDVELHFEKADPIKVELPVKETTYNPAQQ
jgi:copper(I)-binding protein